MNPANELTALLARLEGLGYLALSRGPEHPTDPNPAFAPELSEFLRMYPFLRQDEGYVCFLAMYAGGVFWRDQDALSLGLFGFDSELSTHLVKGPGDTVEHGYLTFCDMVIPPRADPFGEDAIGLGFGFDATGERRWGVYRLFGEGRADYYCETFLQWLRLFVEREGQLGGPPAS